MPTMRLYWQPDSQNITETNNCYKKTLPSTWVYIYVADGIRVSTVSVFISSSWLDRHLGSGRLFNLRLGVISITDIILWYVCLVLSIEFCNKKIELQRISIWCDPHYYKNDVGGCLVI